MKSFFFLCKSNIIFLKNISSSYILLAITFGVQLMIVPYALQVLGKHDFGLYAIVMSFNTFAAIGLGAVSSSIPRLLGAHVAKGNIDNFAEVYSFSVLFHAIYLFLGLCLLSLIGLNFYADFLYQDKYILIVGLSFLYFSIQYLYVTDRYAYASRNQQVVANIFDAITQVIFFISSVTTLYFGWGVAGLIFSLILGQGCTYILSCLYWEKIGVKRWVLISWGGINEIGHMIFNRVGLQYTIYGILLLLFQSDVFLLGFLFGPEIASDYYILWRIPDILILLLLRIPATMSPGIIQTQAISGTNSTQKMYADGFWRYCLVAFSLALVYSIFGKYVLGIWLGDTHIQDEIWVYWLSGVCIFLVAISKWPIFFAVALGAPIMIMWIVALELLIKWGISYFLFPFLGYKSLIIAMAIAYSCTSILFYFRFSKYLFHKKDNGIGVIK